MLEIPKICRAEEGVVDEGNCGNLEVHRANTDTLYAQALKFAGGLLIKQYHMSTRKEVKQP